MRRNERQGVRHGLVNDPAAISMHDQDKAALKDLIGKMDPVIHTIVMIHLRELFDIAEESFRNDQESPLAASMLIASHSGMCMMNEVALEKWGIDGTETER